NRPPSARKAQASSGSVVLRRTAEQERCPAPTSLERELAGQLDDAGRIVRVRRVDQTKGAGPLRGVYGSVIVRTVERNPVEGVEQLRAELEFVAFGNREVFAHAHVPGIDSRSKHPRRVLANGAAASLRSKNEIRVVKVAVDAASVATHGSGCIYGTQVDPM